MKELDFLRTSVQRLHHAKYFNTHQTLVPMSIAEHHYMVAVISMLMQDTMPYTPAGADWKPLVAEQYDTLRTALIHDLEEGVTGDMNAVVKKNGGIREALRGVSKSVLRQQLEGLPSGDRIFRDWEANDPIVKAADKLSMWLYAIEECDMGNSLMRQVCYTVEGWLIEMARQQKWLNPWVAAVRKENMTRGIDERDVRENWR